MGMFSYCGTAWILSDMMETLLTGFVVRQLRSYTVNCTQAYSSIFFSVQVWQPKSPDISYEFRERTMWIWLTKVRIIGIKHIFSLINDNFADS